MARNSCLEICNVCFLGKNLNFYTNFHVMLTNIFIYLLRLLNMINILTINYVINKKKEYILK